MAAAEHAALAFVLNAAWQAPLVVGAGALLARLTRRAPARTRHQVWTLVLGIAVIVPALGVFGLGGAMRPARDSDVHAAVSVPAAAIATAGAFPSDEAFAPGNGAEALGGGPGPAGRPVAAPYGRESMLGALRARAAGLQDAAERRAPIGLIALLLVGIPALVGCVRLARSLAHARALRRAAAPPAAGDPVIPLIDSARGALGLGPVALLVTDEPIAPAAIGLLRPAILLPRSLLRDAREAELRAVLAHEMAHVARRDAVRHVLAELALLPLRFHPVVPFLRRRLAETRELACDEAAAGVVGGARAYARALLDVSATLSGMTRPLTLPGVLGAGLLEVRMRHLTGNPTPWGHMRARLSLALATAVLVTLAVAAIPFAMGGTDAPPAPPEAPPALAAPAGAPPAVAAPETQPAPPPPSPPAPPARPAPRVSHVPPAPPGSTAPAAPTAPPSPAAPPAPTAPPASTAPPAPPASGSTPTPAAAPVAPAPSSTPAPAAAPDPPGSPAQPAPDQDVVITVRSASAGREVEVEGVYVFAPEGSRLHYVKQRTPFEIRTTARLLEGIFSATGEDATIRVEMKSDGGRQDRATATATGSTVTLHTTDVSNGWRIATL